MGKTIVCSGKLIAMEHNAMEPIPGATMDPDAPVMFVFDVKGERLEISVPAQNAGYCLRVLEKWANKRKQIKERKA